MLWGLVAGLVLLGIGLRLPWRGIVGLIALVWLGGMIAHLSLPRGHGLLRALGGDAQIWAIAGCVGALGLGYAGLVRMARARARARARPARRAPAGAFTDAELERYSRHILLREIGGPGQGRLAAANVLVVGAGGLGAPVLLYLAAAGVGRIAVVDGDKVENSNLQRQVIHPDAALGSPKALSAARAMVAQNPFVRPEPHVTRLEPANAADLIAGRDLVLDCTDSYATRDLINRTAAGLGVPVIWGGLSPWEGMVALSDPARGAPCFACAFPEPPAPGLAPDCAAVGVFSALPGVIGTQMAAAALRHLTGAGDSLAGRLILHDGLSGRTREMRLARRTGCPVCAATARPSE
ncbi:HesA/MoeB/ThiF family protein [Phaeovulum vinaykumarii]|uniref:Molybdopterin or thiamine biosynthesis adenylyltransferase n=1 Tax=Phaeovulum vinaykumarii TaxID=407234 RepID=A0A1N7L330_9RHOB|nr:HesA/MoeB/ThiF family protein [Phaeovulum vinaykumarii]SIS68275.1 Molybdopterin or thiamine biosynthesis adenylyltransferase [Phaeovulum vinaykumarii]SOC00188.1 molybdopterin/thiamin biosynthesis adenylyltransferase [Phaeovulum vinaykumarii]